MVVGLACLHMKSFYRGIQPAGKAYSHLFDAVGVTLTGLPEPCVPIPHSPRQNHLLAMLPADVYSRLAADLELIPMPMGWMVYGTGHPLTYVYFPTTCVVSLLYVMENGASAEIAITGNEGLVGVSLFMGGESTPSHAVVQSAGFGYRLKAQILRREFAIGGDLQHFALRYTQALITQMTQTAACNRHHSVDQQLCRWLLLSLDRLPGDELLMTQELIANMLGVRRESVTEAAGKLQAAAIIHYGRGRIKVLNRALLEKRVCECYAVVKHELDRLLDYSETGRQHLPGKAMLGAERNEGNIMQFRRRIHQ